MIAAVWLALAGGGSNAAAGGPCEPAWHSFTSGGEIGLGGLVRTLTVWNGDLIAGGQFTTAGGQTVNRIARWDSDTSEWHPFTSALTEWNGDLIAGGSFISAGGQTVNNIARWDSDTSEWHPFTSALTEWNGDLIAGGFFPTAGGQTVNHIARWDGCADPPIPGDLNGDGVVGLTDLLILLSAWGPCPPPPAECPADLTGDSTVGLADLLILLTAWG